MSSNTGSKASKPAKPLNKGIFLDPVHPSDYMNLNLIYHCEQCSYYKPDEKACVWGLDTSNHTKEAQDKQFNINGRMQFCRFQEID